MIEFIADAALTGGVLICADVAELLDALPMEPLFDLVLTSPPYNLGKEYEKQVPLADYFRWQEQIIGKIVPRLKDTGSLCWQVGSYVDHGEVYPLDIGFAPIFQTWIEAAKPDRLALWAWTALQTEVQWKV